MLYLHKVVESMQEHGNFKAHVRKDEKQKDSKERDRDRKITGRICVRGASYSAGSLVGLANSMDIMVESLM